ncbi:hypothetical protein VIGAN_02194700, partial [Vigna angularis var. angularis]
MIDDPRDPQARVLVPTSEIQFVGKALGTFIAWPKAMIMPYFGPPTVCRLEKQPIAQPVNEAREEAEDHDAISILTSRLNKLRKGPVEMLWELRTFGLEWHVPLYINFDDAYEIIGGEKMFNIS